MACCTHGVLSGQAYDRVEKGALDELVISDTIPTRKDAKNNRINSFNYDWRSNKKNP